MMNKIPETAFNYVVVSSFYHDPNSSGKCLSMSPLIGQLVWLLLNSFKNLVGRKRKSSELCSFEGLPLQSNDHERTVAKVNEQ